MILTVLITASSLGAQEIDFGLKGGVNLANVGGDADGLESRLGLHLGGYTTIAVNDRFSIQPEVLYSTQGAQSENLSEVKLNLDYVIIPVLAKIAITDGFSGYLGPQVGILTRAEVKDNEGSDNVIDEYKSGDFGLAIGLGYEWSNGFNFSGRFNYGLSNIDNVFNNSAEYIERNKVFQFSAGYKLNR